MKKALFILVVITVIFSCSSKETKSTEDTKNQNQVGIPNVNGNIPDTTNAINLSTHKKDSAQKSKDSIK